MRHRLILATFLVGVLPAGNGAAKPAGPAGPAMLHVRGAEIVDGKGRPVVLRGVAFGNDVWTGVRLPRPRSCPAAGVHCSWLWAW